MFQTTVIIAAFVCISAVLLTEITT